MEGTIQEEEGERGTSGAPDSALAAGGRPPHVVVVSAKPPDQQQQRPSRLSSSGGAELSLADRLAQVKAAAAGQDPGHHNHPHHHHVAWRVAQSEVHAPESADPGRPEASEGGADGGYTSHSVLSARSATTMGSTASGSSWLPLRMQQPQQQPQPAPNQRPAAPPSHVAILKQQHAGAALASQLPPRPPVSATLAEQRRAPVATGGAAPLHGHSTPEVRDANHRRVWAALSTVLLAGPALADRLRSARAALEAATDRQVVVLVASSGGRGRGGAYHGLYSVVEGEPQAVDRQQLSGGPPPRDPAAVLAVRIHGAGPPVLTTAMVTTLFKFDTAARELREVGSSHTFTFTTDAVGIDAAHLGGNAGAGRA